MDNEHISNSASVDTTQLGINHLVIRDGYHAWLQIYKNLSRIYKRKTKTKKPYKLLRLICDELFNSYFKMIFSERGRNEKLPEKSILEKDVSSLSSKLLKRFKSDLKFEMTSGSDLKKLQRVLSEATPFINYITLVRPVGGFLWVKAGDEFDPNVHMVKNSRSDFEYDEKAMAKIQLVVSECVYPGYYCEQALFVKAGVIVAERKKEKKEKKMKRKTVKFVNMSDLSMKDYKKRMSLSPDLLRAFSASNFSGKEKEKAASHQRAKSVALGDEFLKKAREKKEAGDEKSKEEKEEKEEEKKSKKKKKKKKRSKRKKSKKKNKGEDSSGEESEDSDEEKKRKKKKKKKKKRKKKRKKRKKRKKEEEEESSDSSDLSSVWSSSDSDEEERKRRKKKKKKEKKKRKKKSKKRKEEEESPEKEIGSESLGEDKISDSEDVLEEEVGEEVIAEEEEGESYGEEEKEIEGDESEEDIELLEEEKEEEVVGEQEQEQEQEAPEESVGGLGQELMSELKALRQLKSDYETEFMRMSEREGEMKKSLMHENCGYIRKQGGKVKSLKWRWFEFHEDFSGFSYYKERGGQKAIKKIEDCEGVKIVLDVEDSIVGEKDVDLAFGLKTEDRLFVLFASCKSEKERWILFLQRWVKGKSNILDV